MNSNQGIVYDILVFNKKNMLISVSADIVYNIWLDISEKLSISVGKDLGLNLPPNIRYDIRVVYVDVDVWTSILGVAKTLRFNASQY